MRLLLAIFFVFCIVIIAYTDVQVVSMNSPSLEGNLLGDPSERQVSVYVPPNYSSGNDYPVIYLLHGFSLQEDCYTTPSPVFPDFPDGGLEAMLDTMISQGAIGEMIVVTPDASFKYGGSFYTNSILSGNYEDYVVDDVVQFIDSNYNTIPNSMNRVVMGQSMGGGGAVMLAMKHPEVFSVVACHSGPLDAETMEAFIPSVLQENPDGMSGPDPQKMATSMIYAMSAAFSPNLDNPPFFVDLPFDYPSGDIIDEVFQKYMEHSAVNLVPKFKNNLKEISGIFFDVGTKDELGMLVHAQAFHEALNSEQIPHTYETYSGTHTSHVFDRLSISFRFVSNHLYPMQSDVKTWNWYR